MIPAMTALIGALIVPIWCFKQPKNDAYASV
jgi:hypothetical protein